MNARGEDVVKEYLDVGTAGTLRSCRILCTFCAKVYYTAYTPHVCEKERFFLGYVFLCLRA